MKCISVVVPVYQVEPYLYRCIDSILNQTHADFDLILVDDGSPDVCGEMCDEFSEAESRICVIHQLNSGLSAARNTGIDWAFACSDSQWLGFVDSDDWIHSRMYEMLLDSAIQQQVKISVCDFIKTTRQESKDAIVSGESQIVNGLDFFTSKKNVVATVVWNKVYQKQLFSGVRYPVGKIHEDEFITYRLLYAAGNIAYIPQELYFYFINDHSITQRTYTLKRLDAIEAFEQQCAFLRTNRNKVYYRLWINKLLLFWYPEHYNSLMGIGETAQAEKLKKRGKMTAIKNFPAVLSMDKNNRNYVFGVYFPLLNKVVAPCENFCVISREEGFIMAVHYYLKKIIQ